MMGALLWLSLTTADAGKVCANDLSQDLNCNGIEATDEEAVDLSDPTCLANEDDDGNPYPNADYYVEYQAFGCQYPVASLDVDDDGLSQGSLTIGLDTADPGLFISLSCDNCPLVSNNDQEDYDCDGVGDVCDVCVEEYDPLQGASDGDTYGDACDNCPYVSNESQTDLDSDGVGDLCDNCPADSNADQFDCEDTTKPVCVDGDGVGDVCDNCPYHDNDEQIDSDGDGVGDVCDNCAEVSNPEQEDSDGDQVGDGCDSCPEVVNASQLDTDDDGFGDDCDICPNTYDPEQLDRDGDGLGDACDICPEVSDPFQEDTDEDGVGDVCDVCPVVSDPGQDDSDGDGFGDACDNCPVVYNSNQADEDGNGVGDSCTAQLRLRGAGGMCSTAGSPKAVLLWLALVMPLVVRRRSRH